MKRPTFLHGALVAGLLAVFASVVVGGLLPIVDAELLFHLLIPALGLAYLLTLFSRNNVRLGRITTLSGWALLTIATWWFAPPMLTYLLIHVLAIWLVRSLYCYSGVLPALMDLALSALSVVAMVWAVSRSGSVFIATWCFFLVQALYVGIPATLTTARASSSSTERDHFNSARRQAEAALRQLFSQ